MRVLLASVAAALLAAPAFAEPTLTSSMPAIRADVVNGYVVVRLDHGVLGSVNSLVPRAVTVVGYVGYDAAGKVVGETTTLVSRRMTYARTKLTPALAGASKIVVSVR